MKISDHRKSKFHKELERGVPHSKYNAANLVCTPGIGPNGTNILAVRRVSPHLVLLDLQMPELDGLDVVRMILSERMPLVAFITAYESYAIQAFEVHAVDYLLKPVDAERLHKTIERSRTLLRQREGARTAQQRVIAAVTELEHDTSRRLLRRIPVRRKNDIIFLLVNDIASVVANSVILHLATIKGDRYALTYTLKELERRLDHEQFIRVSRRALVNVDAITKVSPMPGGTFVVELVNRQQAAVSRLQSKILRETLLRL